MKLLHKEINKKKTIPLAIQMVLWTRKLGLINNKSWEYAKMLFKGKKAKLKDWSPYQLKKKLRINSKRRKSNKAGRRKL